MTNNLQLQNDIDKLVSIMPQKVRNFITPEKMEDVIEIVLDIGRVPEVRHSGGKIERLGEEIINECERGVLQFLSLLPLTRPNNSHLDLEGGNPQHDGHARLQTVAQARVLVQREHAERNVLSRYGSERGRRRTQSRVHHLEEKSCAPEQCVRSGGLDVREKRSCNIINVGVEKIMRIPTDDQRRVLEQLDAVRGGGARVHATLVVIPGGELERR